MNTKLAILRQLDTLVQRYPDFPITSILAVGATLGERPLSSGSNEGDESLHAGLLILRRTEVSKGKEFLQLASLKLVNG